MEYPALSPIATTSSETIRFGMLILHRQLGVQQELVFSHSQIRMVSCEV